MLLDACFDISHWQGQIMWSKVPHNYKLIFIKTTQGHKYIDPMFTKYRDGAEDNNIMVVPYHFITRDPGNLQASHFIDTAKLSHGSACMIDWEAADILPPIYVVEQIIENIRIATNRAPLVYHGIYTVTSKKINACPWHIPKYGPEPDPNKYKWLFWQDSQTKLIPGVKVRVDHDYFNGTEDELKRWFETGVLPEGFK